MIILKFIVEDKIVIIVVGFVIRSLLFYDVMQCLLVFRYRRFGITVPYLRVKQFSCSGCGIAVGCSHNGNERLGIC